MIYPERQRHDLQQLWVGGRGGVSDLSQHVSSLQQSSTTAIQMLARQLIGQNERVR